MPTRLFHKPLSSIIPTFVWGAREVKAWDIFGLFVSTCLISQGLATAAHAANPQHLEQLRTTNSCPKCDLRDAQLTQANLEKADLSGANLEGANMEGANLSNAKLSRVQLSGAQLSGAVLAGANLREAQLSARKQDKKTVVTNLQNA